VAAALALLAALLEPSALVLLLSPTMRQSSELFRKVRDLFRLLGSPVPVVAESVLRVELGNGSRILALPGIESNVRGYSGVDLLIVDEAARVEDGLYFSIRPMLAISKGKLVALSTPYAKRGWFYTAWTSAENWERIRITADQCPRITRDFLADERVALGDRWYRQEYECSFEDIVDAVFAAEDVAAAVSSELTPLCL
jgi:hypothetical protein